jgi:hypothetical protein
MCASNNCELYMEIATDIFRTQNKKAIESLKDFLSDLPCPQSLEEISIAAFHQLAQIDIAAGRWLLHNSDYLLPEVALVDRSIESFQILLQERGFLPDRDFQFEPSDRIYLSKQARIELFKDILPSDRLILTEILKIQDYG